MEEDEEGENRHQTSFPDAPSVLLQAKATNVRFVYPRGVTRHTYVSAPPQSSFAGTLSSFIASTDPAMNEPGAARTTGSEGMHSTGACADETEKMPALMVLESCRLLPSVPQRLLFPYAANGRAQQDDEQDEERAMMTEEDKAWELSQATREREFAQGTWDVGAVDYRGLFDHSYAAWFLVPVFSKTDLQIGDQDDASCVAPAPTATVVGTSKTVHEDRVKTQTITKPVTTGRQQTKVESPLVPEVKGNGASARLESPAPAPLVARVQISAIAVNPKVAEPSPKAGAATTTTNLRTKRVLFKADEEDSRRQSTDQSGHPPAEKSTPRMSTRSPPPLPSPTARAERRGEGETTFMREEEEEEGPVRIRKQPGTESWVPATLRGLDEDEEDEEDEAAFRRRRRPHPDVPPDPRYAPRPPPAERYDYDYDYDYDYEHGYEYEEDPVYVEWEERRRERRRQRRRSVVAQQHPAGPPSVSESTVASQSLALRPRPVPALASYDQEEYNSPPPPGRGPYGPPHDDYDYEYGRPHGAPPPGHPYWRSRKEPSSRMSRYEYPYPDGRHASYGPARRQRRPRYEFDDEYDSEDSLYRGQYPPPPPLPPMSSRDRRRENPYAYARPPHAPPSSDGGGSSRQSPAVDAREMSQNSTEEAGSSRPKASLNLAKMQKEATRLQREDEDEDVDSSMRQRFAGGQSAPRRRESLETGDRMRGMNRAAHRYEGGRYEDLELDEDMMVMSGPSARRRRSSPYRSSPYANYPPAPLLPRGYAEEEYAERPYRARRPFPPSGGGPPPPPPQIRHHGDPRYSGPRDRYGHDSDSYAKPSRRAPAGYHESDPRWRETPPLDPGLSVPPPPSVPYMGARGPSSSGKPYRRGRPVESYEDEGDDRDEGEDRRYAMARQAPPAHSGRMIATAYPPSEPYFSPRTAAPPQQPQQPRQISLPSAESRHEAASIPSRKGPSVKKRRLDQMETDSSPVQLSPARPPVPSSSSSSVAVPPSTSTSNLTSYSVVTQPVLTLEQQQAKAGVPILVDEPVQPQAPEDRQRGRPRSLNPVRNRNRKNPKTPAPATATATPAVVAANAPPMIIRIPAASESSSGTTLTNRSPPNMSSPAQNPAATSATPPAPARPNPTVRPSTTAAQDKRRVPFVQVE